MIALIGIFVITSSATIMNGLDINFTTKTVSNPQNTFWNIGFNDDAGKNCPECGSRMKIRNPGMSCAVLHRGSECDFNAPYCPNEKNHNKKMIGIETIEQFVRVSTSSDVSAGEIARPTCLWTGHKWKEIIYSDPDENGLMTVLEDETQQCVYCDKKRVKKEVWEDVK